MLIIETGAIVPNANSFVTRAELIAYAALRGVVIADEDATDVFLVLAADYLGYREPQMQGRRVSALQTLPYPRTGVMIDGVIVGTDEIPNTLKLAQLQLGLEANNGVKLIATKSAESFVTMKKLGPIETQYSEAVALSGQIMPTLPLVEARLSPLLGGVAGVNRVYRV